MYEAVPKLAGLWNSLITRIIPGPKMNPEAFRAYGFSRVR
jgi:hypothetical protein